MKGICVAGNMIVDALYPIQGIPAPGELTTVTNGISRSTGGALCNVIIDLARLEPTMPLLALGRIGTDAEGDFVLDSLRRYPNIDLSQIRRDGKTSFTAVMADEKTKQRTFYHYRGANAGLCQADFDWKKLEVSILHVGYILLLDALDEADALYGTRMARLLREAQAYGIRTSIDVVTEAGDRFQKIVPPALRYTDYCIINEMEAQATTGVTLRNTDGTLLEEHIPQALVRLKEMGVSQWAVIHSPEGAYGFDQTDAYCRIPSLRLPEGYVKGTVGAGDAFVAGVLLAAWKDAPLEAALQLGTATAACSLQMSSATDGVISAADALRRYHDLR